jgi:hypothetical protein
MGIDKRSLDGKPRALGALWMLRRQTIEVIVESEKAFWKGKQKMTWNGIEVQPKTPVPEDRVRVNFIEASSGQIMMSADFPEPPSKQFIQGDIFKAGGRSLVYGTELMGPCVSVQAGLSVRIVAKRG